MQTTSNSSVTQKTILSLAAAGHTILAIGLPLLLASISYLMCHDASPGDGCGAFLGFFALPFYLVAFVGLSVIVIIISLCSRDRSLIFLSVWPIIVVVHVFIPESQLQSQFILMGGYALLTLIINARLLQHQKPQRQE